MAQIKKFTRPDLQVINNEVEAAMKKIAEKFKLSFQLDSLKYGTSHCSIKTTFELIGKTNDEPKRHLSSTGFVDVPQNGTKFTSRGMEYEVVGYNANRPKYPILAKRVSDNTRFKFPIEAIK